jgi:GNAT superfamily N-acetyltransferase
MLARDMTTRLPAQVTLRGLVPGDMGWVVQQHGEIYAREYGWNSEFEALVADISAKVLRRFDPEWDKAWIAELNGERVGSVFVVRKSKTVAQLRMLILTPAARGLGLGARLTDECLAFARGKGYRKMVLWTNSQPDRRARHLRPTRLPPGDQRALSRLRPRPGQRDLGTAAVNRALVAAAATGVQVGAAIVASRFVVGEVPPLTLALMRYAIGFLCLAPFAWPGLKLFGASPSIRRSLFATTSGVTDLASWPPWASDSSRC